MLSGLVPRELIAAWLYGPVLSRFGGGLGLFFGDMTETLQEIVIVC